MAEGCLPFFGMTPVDQVTAGSSINVPNALFHFAEVVDGLGLYRGPYLMH